MGEKTWEVLGTGGGTASPLVGGTDMAESTSVHPTAVGVVGHPVPYRTPETELLTQWQYARDMLNRSEMFEAAAYQDLLSAAQNVEIDPDRLDRAIEYHTEVSVQVAADRSAEDGLRSRTRMALRRRVEQTWLRLDAGASLAAADASDLHITRAVADRVAVEGRRCRRTPSS